MNGVALSSQAVNPPATSSQCSTSINQFTPTYPIDQEREMEKFSGECLDFDTVPPGWDKIMDVCSSHRSGFTSNWATNNTDSSCSNTLVPPADAASSRPAVVSDPVQGMGVLKFNAKTAGYELRKPTKLARTACGPCKARKSYCGGWKTFDNGEHACK